MKKILLMMIWVLSANLVYAQTTFYYSSNHKIYVQTDTTQQVIRLRDNANAQTIANDLKSDFPLSEIQEKKIED